MANQLNGTGEDRTYRYTEEEIRVMREFSMVEFMRLHGASIEHNGRMYSSPWREDKNKSLEINDARHLWHDFGDTEASHMKRSSRTGTMYAGGDTIDFVRVFKGFDSRSEAMDYLAGMMPGFIRKSEVSVPVRRLRGPLSGFTCHVSEPTTAWSEQLSASGVWMEVHRSGTNRDGKPYMDAEQIDEAAIHIDRANETLQRRPDKFMDTLSRYWAQVDGADSVFIIGRFAVGSQAVLDGAAAWPAQMALDEKKPVYLYEIDKKCFYRCDEASGWKWEHMNNVPVFTKSFAAVAPRMSTHETDAVVRVCVDKTVKQRSKTSHLQEAEEKTEAVRKPVAKGRIQDILSDIVSRPFSYGLNRFDSVVQFVQWSKAVWAGADDVAQTILNAPTPEEAWSLGESLKDIDMAAWNAMLSDVRETALRVSFLSNTDAAQALLDADVKTIMKDPVLMKVRDEFKANMVGTSMDGEDNHYVIEEIRRGVSFRPNRTYMEDVRHIDRVQLSRYCADVRVHVETLKDGQVVKGNSFIAVGFPNKSGGFELRKDSFVNASGETIPGMKKCTSKDITVISGDGNFLTDPLSPTTSRVLVFEGFVDFLSYMCWGNRQTPVEDCVILNSTSMVSTALPFIAAHDSVFAYLDNDKAGQAATEAIRVAVKEIATKEGRSVSFEDGSSGYEGYKDVSEAYSEMIEKQKAEESQQEV